MAEATTKKKTTKAPSVKQLRARARFVKMVKARAKAARAAKRAAGVKVKPKKRTVAVNPRYDSAPGSAWARRKEAQSRIDQKIDLHKLTPQQHERLYRAMSKAQEQDLSLTGMVKVGLAAIGKRVAPKRKRNIAGAVMGDGLFHPFRAGIGKDGRPAKKGYKPSALKKPEKFAYSRKAKAIVKRGHKAALKGQRSLTAGTSLKQRAISNPSSKAIPQHLRKTLLTIIQKYRSGKWSATQARSYLSKLADKEATRRGLTKNDFFDIFEYPNFSGFIRDKESIAKRSDKYQAAGVKSWTRHVEKKTGKIRYGSKPNPASAAKGKALFKEFAGRPARKVTPMYAPKGSGAKGTLGAMGKLAKIKVAGRSAFDFRPTDAVLARDGKNKMFVLGKGYKLNQKGKRHNPTGFEDLGVIDVIEYEATKSHLDGVPTIYVHKMGEEGGAKPHLLINDEGLAIISGGTYRIDERGIID